MKKLELKFGGIKEMLTKEQMKMISGGTFYCGVEGSSNPNPIMVPCNDDPCACQDGYDDACENGPDAYWCSDVDCGCK